MKKMRKQRREEREQEKQQNIQLGLMEAPTDKVGHSRLVLRVRIALLKSTVQFLRTTLFAFLPTLRTLHAQFVPGTC